MSTLPLWWTVTLGCPWISPARHELNQRRLDGDADTDPDPDSGTADTGPTSTGCVEDGDEPNDVYSAATLLNDLPVSLDAASCAGNVDHYRVAVGVDSVLAADLECTGDAVLRIWREGVLGASTPAACGTKTRLGLGPGDYVVALTPVPGDAATDLGDYHLALAADDCPFDSDGDGVPSSACPGAGDCNDNDADTHRGALDDPTTPADEDCDGLPDLAGQAGCTAQVNNPVDVVVPPLPCGAADVDPVWHHYTFPVDLLNVEIYLTPDEQTDLFALYVDDAATYGFDQGEDELDSEAACEPAAFGACPSACIGPGTGTGHLWVAQRDCTGPVNYQLRLKVGPASPAVTLQVDQLGPPLH
jgi:hypothetical protein